MAAPQTPKSPASTTSSPASSSSAAAAAAVARPTVNPKDSTFERIKYNTIWTLTILVIFLTAMVLNVLQAVALPVYYFRKTYYRTWIQTIDFSYSCLLVFLMEWKSGMTHVYYGDAGRFLDRRGPGGSLPSAIYMSNHTSYADWVVFYGVLCRQGGAGAIRFFLKDLAKVLPGIGWGCYLSEFFLVRKSSTRGDWNRDGDVIVNRLKSFAETGDLIYPAIFPEGTFHDGADPTLVERTQKFAKENGLSVLEYLLTPRVRGFYACTSNLRGHAEYIVDQTIAFTGNKDRSQVPYYTAKPLSDATRVMPDAADLLAYRGPEHVHIHIRLIPLADVPTDEAGAKQFLMKVWDEKETLLRDFRANGDCFPGQAHTRPNALWGSAASTGGVGYLVWHFLLWVVMMFSLGYALSLMSMWLLGNVVLVIGACALVGILVQHFWKDK